MVQLLEAEHVSEKHGDVGDYLVRNGTGFVDGLPVSISDRIVKNVWEGRNWFPVKGTVVDCFSQTDMKYSPAFMSSRRNRSPYRIGWLVPLWTNCEVFFLKLLYDV